MRTGNVTADSRFGEGLRSPWPHSNGAQRRPSWMGSREVWASLRCVKPVARVLQARRVGGLPAREHSRFNATRPWACFTDPVLLSECI